MHAVRCSCLAKSGHRCRRRTSDPRGVCSSSHGDVASNASSPPTIGPSSDGRHIRNAVDIALAKAHSGVSFMVTRTARWQATVEWADGPDESDVLASAATAFASGFGSGPDGRTLRAANGSAAVPSLVLIRHGSGRWRTEFDRDVARRIRVGAA